MSWKQVPFFLLILTVVTLVNSISYEEDTTVSGKERDALKQFKAQVIPKVPKSSYVQNYVKDDLYWIHWLRAKRLNIRQAEDMFLNHLKWRKEEKVDTIDQDQYNLAEWVEFQKSYPVFYNDTVDRTGRPVVEIWLGEWNLRQGVLAGRSKQIFLGLGRFFELINRRLYKARAEGKMVSQGQVLVDLDGFNLPQFACPACIPVIVRLATLFETQFPYLFDNIILINMPQSFNIVLRMLAPVLSDSTSKAIKSYPNKDKWLKVLDEKIDRSQRSVRLGGTIVRDRE